MAEHTHHHHKYYQSSLCTESCRNNSKVSLTWRQHQDDGVRSVSLSPPWTHKTTAIYRMTLWEQPEDYQNNSPTIKYIRKNHIEIDGRYRDTTTVRTTPPAGNTQEEEDISDSEVLSMEQEPEPHFRNPSPGLATRESQPLNWFEDQGRFMTKSTYFN